MKAVPANSPGSARVAEATLAVATPAFKALSPAAITVSRRMMRTACSSLISPLRTCRRHWKVLMQPAVTAVITAALPAARALCCKVAAFR
ncbi:hypothetical protein D3C71_2034470 [compost metagenome]